MPKPQEIRELAERLGERKATLRQMEADVRRVQGHILDLERRLEAIAPTTPTSASTSASSSDVATTILALVESQPDREFSAGDIQKTLGDAVSHASVRAALSRLEREKHIMRVRRGAYEAKKGGTE